MWNLRVRYMPKHKNPRGFRQVELGSDRARLPIAREGNQQYRDLIAEFHVRVRMHRRKLKVFPAHTDRQVLFAGREESA